jgi:hypothetical protein
MNGNCINHIPQVHKIARRKPIDQTECINSAGQDGTCMVRNLLQKTPENLEFDLKKQKN